MTIVANADPLMHRSAGDFITHESYPLRKLKKSIDDFKKYFEKYMKFMIFFSYGVTVIFIILAEHYLQIFYNLKDYHESIFCFKILMLSLLFMTINSPLHGGMLAAHKEKTILLITVVNFSSS